MPLLKQHKDCDYSEQNFYFTVDFLKFLLFELYLWTEKSLSFEFQFWEARCTKLVREMDFKSYLWERIKFNIYS